MKISCLRPSGLRGWSECVRLDVVLGIFSVFVCCLSDPYHPASPMFNVRHKFAAFFKLSSHQTQFTLMLGTLGTYRPTFDFSISNFCNILPIYEIL